MVSAKVIADSVSLDGDRLTTMEVTFHRFVLAEFNTHRMFSRNSASSRAIPVEKQLAKIAENPAYPLKWPCEQPGMSGGADLDAYEMAEAEELFESIAQNTVDSIEQYLAAHPDKTKRLHKSLLNRLIEPFMWHTAIVSSTDWENFFRQRVSPLAQPEIQAVAKLMLEAYEASEPSVLAPGDWHLPYIDAEDWVWASRYVMEQNGGVMPQGMSDKVNHLLCQVSVARCARVSYLTHDGVRDQSIDLGLFEKLTSSFPPHASPLEHVATPNVENKQDVQIWTGKEWWANGQEKWIEVPRVGNFLGWDQLRHRIVGF